MSALCQDEATAEGGAILTRLMGVATDLKEVPEPVVTSPRAAFQSCVYQCAAFTDGTSRNGIAWACSHLREKKQMTNKATANIVLDPSHDRL